MHGSCLAKSKASVKENILSYSFVRHDRIAGTSLELLILSVFRKTHVAGVMTTGTQSKSVRTLYKLLRNLAEIVKTQEIG